MTTAQEMTDAHREDVASRHNGDRRMSVVPETVAVEKPKKPRHFEWTTPNYVFRVVEECKRLGITTQNDVAQLVGLTSGIITRAKQDGEIKLSNDLAFKAVYLDMIEDSYEGLPLEEVAADVRRRVAAAQALGLKLTLDADGSLRVQVSRTTYDDI